MSNSIKKIIEFYKKHTAVTYCYILCLTVFCIISCYTMDYVYFIQKLRSSNPIEILGPNDKPDVFLKKWESYEVCYWIVTSDNPNEDEKHIFVISGDELKKLQEIVVNTAEYSPLSLGVSDNLSLILLENGESWNVDMNAQREMYICKRSDHYYSYCLAFSTWDYYLALKDLCLRHAQQTNKKYIASNIRICTNRTRDGKLIPFTARTP